LIWRLFHFRRLDREILCGLGSLAAQGVAEGAGDCANLKPLLAEGLDLVVGQPFGQLFRVDLGEKLLDGFAKRFG
jgi:hypothetical protein